MDGSKIHKANPRAKLWPRSHDGASHLAHSADKAAKAAAKQAAALAIAEGAARKDDDDDVLDDSDFDGDDLDSDELEAVLGTELDLEDVREDFELKIVVLFLTAIVLVAMARASCNSVREWAQSRGNSPALHLPVGSVHSAVSAEGPPSPSDRVVSSAAAISSRGFEKMGFAPAPAPAPAPGWSLSWWDPFSRLGYSMEL